MIFLLFCHSHFQKREGGFGSLLFSPVFFFASVFLLERDRQGRGEGGTFSSCPALKLEQGRKGS